MGIPKEKLQEALETYSFELRADVRTKLFELEEFVYREESYEELIARQMDFCHITPDGLARLMRVSRRELQTILNPPFEIRKAINKTLEEILEWQQENKKEQGKKKVSTMNYYKTKSDGDKSTRRNNNKGYFKTKARRTKQGWGR